MRMTLLHLSGESGIFLSVISSIFNAYNFFGIRYKKSIGQILSAILDSVLGQEDYAKT
jgi:hypothetical protein